MPKNIGNKGILYFKLAYTYWLRIHCPDIRLVYSFLIFGFDFDYFIPELGIKRPARPEQVFDQYGRAVVYGFPDPDPIYIPFLRSGTIMFHNILPIHVERTTLPEFGGHWKYVLFLGLLIHD